MPCTDPETSSYMSTNHIEHTSGAPGHRVTIAVLPARCNVATVLTAQNCAGLNNSMHGTTHIA